MAIGLNPYLQFDGNAREAVEFYHSVLGGELTISTFSEGMPPGSIDESSADRIMHASLYVDRGLHLMVADTLPGMGSADNGTISLSSDGTQPGDDAILRGYWDGLAADGTITMPLEVAPWGDAFGQLDDKFGVSWMVNITASSAT